MNFADTKDVDQDTLTYPSDLQPNNEQDGGREQATGSHLMHLPDPSDQIEAFGLSPCAFSYQFEDRILLNLSVQSKPKRIYVPMAAMKLCLESFGYTQEIRSLKPNCLLAISLHLYNETLKDAAASIDLPVKINAAQICSELPPVHLSSYELDLEGEPLSQFVTDIETEVLQDMLTATLPLIEIGPDVPAIPKMLDLSYQTEPVEISISELEALTIGDGFLLPDGWKGIEVCKVQIDAGKTLSVQESDTGLVVVSQDSEDGNSDRFDSDANSDAAFEMTEVSFELARSKASLQDIDAIETGQSLPFDQTITDRVQVLWRGERLATGKLIELNGVHAVRIFSIH